MKNRHLRKSWVCFRLDIISSALGRPNPWSWRKESGIKTRTQSPRQVNYVRRGHSTSWDRQWAGICVNPVQYPRPQGGGLKCRQCALTTAQRRTYGGRNKKRILRKFRCQRRRQVTKSVADADSHSDSQDSEEPGPKSRARSAGSQVRVRHL